MCVLELSTGYMLRVTPEHRFFSQGEWITAEELTVGNTLQCKDGSFAIIDNKVILASYEQVFNLEIEDNENYYVTEDGILVHNGYKGENTLRTPTFDEFKESIDGRFPSDDIANQAYDLFENKKWKELEQLFNEHNINGRWPPNRGAVGTVDTTLKTGDTFDRYGGWIDETGNFQDKGVFVGKDGTPYTERALPKGSDVKPYRRYEVIKDIPDVKEGEVIPWFGEKGGGIQYELPANINDLIREGFIKVIG